MYNAVNAILSGQEQSIRCADSLKMAGFTRDEISVLLPDVYGAQELGFQRRSKACNGFVLGIIFGGILGAEWGYFAFLFPGSLPGFFLANPALSAALCTGACFAVVAAIVGTSIGALVPQYQVCKYDRKTRMGSSLISVHVDNPMEQNLAERILRYEGAQEIALAGEDISRPKPAQLAAQ